MNKKLLLFTLLAFVTFSYGQVYDTAGTKDAVLGTSPIWSGGSLADGSYCQLIYYPSDINADTLYGVEFESNINLNASQYEDWEIWITETASNNFNSGLFVTAGISKVFDGKVEVHGNKLRVYFDNYYIYSKTQNLVVGLLEKTNGQGVPPIWQTNMNSTDKTSIMTLYNAPNPYNPAAPTYGNIYYAQNGSNYIRPFTKFITSEKCSTPTNINFSDLTSVSTTVSFDRLNASTWDILFDPTHTTSGNINLTATDTFQNVTSLQSFRSYDVTVTANCGVKGSSDPITVRLTTPSCDSIYNSFFEDFEGTVSGSYVTDFCFNNIGSNGTLSYCQYLGNGNNGSSRCVNGFGGNGGNAFLILPRVSDIFSGTLSFYCKDVGVGNWNTIEIGIMSDPKDHTTFTSLHTITNSSGVFTWEEFEIQMASFTSPSTTGYIALKMDGQSSKVDDIKFNGPPTPIESFVQDFEDFTLNSGVKEEGWWGHFGTPGSYGFSAFGSVSNHWAFPYSNANHLNVTASSTAPTAYLVSPEVTELNKKVKFAAMVNGTVRPIYVGSIAKNLEDTNSFIGLDTIIPTGAYQEYTINYASYVGTNTRVAFKFPGGSGYGEIKMDLIEYGQPDTTVYDTLCNGDTLFLSNRFTDTAGSYFDTLIGSNGDSVVKYELSYYNNTSTIIESVCDTFISPSGKILTSTGIYFDTISAIGSPCDSIITIDLTIDISPIITSIASPTVCVGDSTLVTIVNAQSGIEYALYDSTTSLQIGNSVVGNGSNIDFSTGPVLANKTLYLEANAPNIAVADSSINLGNTNDRIEVTLPTSFDFSNGYSFQGWVKTTTAFLGNGNKTLFQFVGNTVTDLECYIQNGSGELAVLHNRNNSGTVDFHRFSLATVSHTNAFHLAVSYDRIANEIKVYLDGSLVEATKTYEYRNNPILAPVKSANSRVVYGHFINTTYTGEFDGNLDELRIWDYPLSASENAATYNSCLTGTETGLVTYLKLDDGTNNSIQDIVLNNTTSVINPSAATVWNKGYLNCYIAGCMISSDYLNVDIIDLDTMVSQSGNILTANQTGATYRWLDCNNNYAFVTGETNQSYTANVGSWAVEVTYNGCVDTSRCISINTTSIHINESDVKVYPNPVNNIMFISGININANNTSVVNIDGKLVPFNLSGSNKIDVSSFEKGNYILIIKTKDKVIRKRFTKI